MAKLRFITPEHPGKLLPLKETKRSLKLKQLKFQLKISIIVNVTFGIMIIFLLKHLLN